MMKKVEPRTFAELIRFPLVFGTILLALGTTFYFRKDLIPSVSEEQQNKFRGSEKDKELLRKAMESSQR